MSSSPTSSRAGQESVLERVGLPRALLWAYVGLAFFMIGDGVESNFLVTYFVNDFKYSDLLANNIILFYGVFVAIGSWLSGVLSTLLSPKRVMLIGAAIWAVFEVAFLGVGLTTRSVPIILFTYGVRGLGYPLFAFAFLTWINRAVRREDRGTAGGWFWFMFTGGLPVIGTAVAAVAIPLIGQYATFWLSLALVVAGAAIAILGAHEAHGTQRISDEGTSAREELRAGISILWRYPKVGRLAAARCINTGAQYGFFVALPLFLQDDDKVPGGPAFSQTAYLLFVVITFGANVLTNPMWGRIGDRFGWRTTVTFAGGLGCAVTTLLVYFVPLTFTHSFVPLAIVGALYGITLAGYVPLSALITSIIPEGEQGNAIAVYSLAAGASTVLGPLVYLAASPLLGTIGVIIAFAVLYVISAAMTYYIRDAADPGENRLAGDERAARTA